MKKILLAGLLSGLLSSPAFAAIKEVIKEASGSGPTQHQAISEALLVAVQSVNGASVSSQMDYEETVSLSVNHQGWTYTGKVSPVFSVANQGSGSVTKFQVLSVSGAQEALRSWQPRCRSSQRVPGGFRWSAYDRIPYIPRY